MKKRTSNFSASVAEHVVQVVAGSPWIILTVGGRQFWLKKHFSPTTEYALLVTDLVSVWTDRKEAAQMGLLHHAFNPKLAFKSADETMRRLSSKLDPSSQNLLSLREDTAAVLNWELAIHVSNLVQFKWTFDLQAMERTSGAELLKRRLMEPALQAGQELVRQYAMLFGELVRKDAELAALAKRGHKTDRAMRTERLAHTVLAEFAESELRTSFGGAVTQLEPTFDVFLRHFAGGSAQEQAQQQFADEEHQQHGGEASVAHQSNSPSQHGPGNMTSLSQQAPPSPSLSPVPSARTSPDGSPAHGTQRGAAVVVEGATKKRKVVNRKQAFV